MMVLFYDTLTHRRPRMARHLRAAIARVKVQIRSQLSADVDAMAREVGHVWREHKLTPSVTIWLFMLQVLHGNIAITALRQLGGVVMQASSYCQARKRLPLELFTRLFDAMAHSAGALMQQSSQE